MPNALGLPILSPGSTGSSHSDPRWCPVPLTGSSPRPLAARVLPPRTAGEGRAASGGGEATAMDVLGS